MVRLKTEENINERLSNSLLSIKSICKQLGNLGEGHLNTGIVGGSFSYFHEMEKELTSLHRKLGVAIEKHKSLQAVKRGNTIAGNTKRMLERLHIKREVTIK